MIIMMKQEATKGEVLLVLNIIKEMGYKTDVLHFSGRKVIMAPDKGDEGPLQSLRNVSGVESVFTHEKPYILACRKLQGGKTTIRVRGFEVGGKDIVMIAGPCAVENEEQIFLAASAVKEGGAHILRGGAFKPRTSPYSFQGMGECGLKLLKKAGEAFQLPVQTEILNTEDVGLVAEYADILQVGARNVQNFPLLKKLGKLDKPVILKRGMSTTVEELLMSAEYILSGGNSKVILCERGIRTFETATRNTLDLSCIPVLNHETHLPVIVDPCHATGNWKYVIPLCKAAVAAGADGLMVEVHPNPEKAFSDGPQSLKPETFLRLMQELKPYMELASEAR